MPNNNYEEIRQKYVKHYVAGNAAGLAELFTEDCLMLAPDAPMAMGKAEAQAIYEEQFNKMAPSALSINPTDEVTLGDWGYGAGTWIATATVKATDAVVQLEGKYLNVVKRQPDGNWKIHRHTWNAPTQAATAGAPQG